ncbi:MAG TPA: carotenoid biosynthesis protein [Fimbriimonas sp.]|nr:carotenoid biosynthesis protein [Fimbriimonas sp.]
MRVKPIFQGYCAIVAFSCLGSIASKAFQLDPGPIKPIFSFLMIALGVTCIAIEMGNWKSVAFILGLGTAAEICSLATGFPFGRYHYTDQWIPTIPLWGNERFPLLLPFAWVMIVGGAASLVQRKASGWWFVVATGLLCAAIDAPMERAMIDVFRYWTWVDVGPVFGAPIVNSLGWFGVAAVAAIPLKKGAPDQSGQYSSKVVAVFCGFVAICGWLDHFSVAWLLLIAIGATMFFNERMLDKT